MMEAQTPVTEGKDKCVFIHALNIIGGKWRLAIIWNLCLCKCMRYNELKRNVPGITNIMLTRSLQDLEKHNLVKRVQYSEIPPHVEYSATDSCLELFPALKVIYEWAKINC
jgi:DNA-binding HxlR family transcriptional regulator